jgi:hypothetical protein
MSNSTCLTSCSSNADCLSSHYCQGGVGCVMKLPDGANCVNNGDCQGGVCTQGYADSDNDGFGNPSAGAKFCGALPQTPVRYVASNTDCCDSNNNVRPNQTSFFTTPIPSPCSGLGYNYDCSSGGSITHQYSVLNGCAAGTCSTGNCTGSGWQNTTFPGCGNSGSYRTCSQPTLNCGGPVIISCSGTTTATRVDACR